MNILKTLANTEATRGKLKKICTVLYDLDNTEASGSNYRIHAFFLLEQLLYTMFYHLRQSPDVSSKNIKETYNRLQQILDAAYVGRFDELAEQKGTPQ